ncbi:MAG: M23 family metallopeptidase [Woeseiaceae bacterium]|nr:M23 family metallopeptidase [Woeseiaceae bacterium]
MAGLVAVSPAQTLYKYRGLDGEWNYSDRPPPDDRLVEVRELERAAPPGKLNVSYSFENQRVRLIASNEYYIPLELKLRIEQISGLEFPDAEDQLHWVVPARSERVLIDLGLLENGEPPFLEYGVEFHPGDPRAEHRPEVPYRVPFAVATHFPVTQAYPDVVTHMSPDSYHAVDMAMPIGTDVFAARGGVVFDVASGNFTAGLDPERDGPKANVVQILHDDGTYAVYAHLNTNTVRVRPGDRVERGQYIADSGNTGFSSGPHLHFAILRNAGMRTESVPVVFEGANEELVMPATGMSLTAY